MFDGYTTSELMSIFAMQGFAGLSLFSVFVLMALGLAIIFGQMGVINMAHGEFMILGAYTTYLVSGFFQSVLPGLFGGYFFYQTQQTSREFQKYLQEHSESLAVVVELNIRNALLSQRGLEETVAASLENSARFIHYLNSIEAFFTALARPPRILMYFSLFSIYLE